MSATLLGLAAPRAGRRKQRGTIDVLPSGALRVGVYAGKDPVTGRRYDLQEIIPPGPKAETLAEEARTRLLNQVDEQRNPRTKATVNQLLDRYLAMLDVMPPAWIKTALLNTQEVVIGGWSPGQGRRARTLGALLLGAHDSQGRLRYLGQVGTGFAETMLAELVRQLRPLHRPDSPFDEPVPREHARDARCVQPQLVGEVVYRTLTPEGRLRHAAWRGLRPDRDADEIKAPFLD
jgi:ATP dependent DNA ligase C terminal region